MEEECLAGCFVEQKSSTEKMQPCYRFYTSPTHLDDNRHRTDVIRP